MHNELEDQLGALMTFSFYSVLQRRLFKFVTHVFRVLLKSLDQSISIVVVGKQVSQIQLVRHDGIRRKSRYIFRLVMSSLTRHVPEDLGVKITHRS